MDVNVTAVKTENSTKNPVFVGEKSADELDWGEWTMDLDAATSKVWRRTRRPPARLARSGAG